MANKIKAIAYLFIISMLAAHQSAISQTCISDDDLTKLPGKFTDHKWTPAGGHTSSYSAVEQTLALKTLSSIETNFVKYFWGDGTNGKASFGFSEGNYFNNLFLGQYSFTTGFYELICKDGNIKTAHEFGTDFKITINPFIEPGLNINGRGRQYDFSVPGNRKNFSNTINLFRYMIFSNKEEPEKINSGNSYIESKPIYHDAYDKHPDVVRNWYFAPAGKMILIEVTRKEYLESLLEFYEREKPGLLKEMDRLIAIDKSTLKLYEKEKDGKSKKDYDYFLNRIKEYETDRQRYENAYKTKKDKVTSLLKSNAESWLNEPAVLSKEVIMGSYCRSGSLKEYEETGCFSFNDFASIENGYTVYKWNPDLFKQQPATSPVFIKVSLRYKSGIELSEKIRDYYTKNLDFTFIKSILNKK